MSTKILTLLNSLSEKEIKHFSIYIMLKGDHGNGKLKTVLNFIVPYRGQVSLPKEKLFKKIYPGEKFVDLRVRHMISDLKKELEEFLAYLEFQKSKDLKEIYLLKALRRKNLEAPFFSHINTFKKKRGIPQKGIDPNAYLNHYLFNQEILIFQEQSSRSEDMNLEALSADLDDFYLVSKLKTACNMLIHEGLVQKKYDHRLVNEVVEFVERQQYFEHPLINVYYNYYRALTEENNDQYFITIRKILETRDHGFSLQEQRDVYLLLINFCVRKFNQGKAHYIHELFSIYKEALDNGAMFTRKKLTPFTFKNIVSAGLYIKEYDWTRDFIESYQSKLDDKNKESIVALSLAKLYYESEEYDKVLEILRTTKIKDLYLKLNGKVIQVRTLYDMGEYDLTLSQVENFQLFLRREKMMTYHKTNYNNYIKCMKKILETNAFDKEDVEKLRSYIEGIQILSEKKWLLERVNRLM